MIEIEKLVDIPFSWGETDLNNGLDCYQLAKLARKALLPTLKPFPDYDYIYNYHSRESIPPSTILDLFQTNERASQIIWKEDLQIGDIGLISCRYGVGMMTYLGAKYYLGFNSHEISAIIPDRLISSFILSYWRVN